MTREEWLKWRQGGVGGSDAPIVLGLSPWMNIKQLYEEKIAENIVDKPPNYAQAKGIRMEPRIRALYEFQAGESFNPKLLMVSDLPFMRASLDGLSEDGRRAIEIKVSGRQDWQASLDFGIVPKKYYAQIQHILLVSGAEVCIYLSYLFSKHDEPVLDSKKLVKVEVHPDEEYQRMLLEKCSHFWNENVMKRVSP